MSVLVRPNFVECCAGPLDGFSLTGDTGQWDFRPTELAGLLRNTDCVYFISHSLVQVRVVTAGSSGTTTTDYCGPWGADPSDWGISCGSGTGIDAQPYASFVAGCTEGSTAQLSNCCVRLGAVGDCYPRTLGADLVFEATCQLTQYDAGCECSGSPTVSSGDLLTFTVTIPAGTVINAGDLFYSNVVNLVAGAGAGCVIKQVEAGAWTLVTF